jgi:pantoate--beta-alanine ligase
MSNPVVLTRRSMLSEFVASAKAKGQTIGLVPTMGALHEGHISLTQKSAAENDLTIVTIFVNPKQFAPNEDFARYPRQLENDLALLAPNKVDAVFAPSIGEMYPEGFLTKVSVPDMSHVLCGAFRESHFDGVCTVVLLLLNLAQANKAYFGLKDFQQFTILRRMCLDLAHPTELVPMPTVREADGLALSSRNRYLDTQARQIAAAIPRSLAQVAQAFLSGERQSTKLIQIAQNELKNASLTPQYLDLRDTECLRPITNEITSDAVLAIAQPMATANGSCRLIDNIVLSANPFYRSILEDLIARAI